MGRKERRALERKIKHIQKTKPWELQALIQEKYARELIENRVGKDTLAPGDKVMLDVKKIMEDPDWTNMKEEYKEFVEANANKVFTLKKEARQSGPFTFVSFNEDETDPRWLFMTGHVKKVESEKINGLEK